MYFLITKNDLKEILLNRLYEDIKDKDFAFNTEEMNKTFIQQTSVFKNDYFFTFLDKKSVFKDELYCLDDDLIYEESYQKTKKLIENDFRFNKNRVIEYSFEETDNPYF